MDQDQPKRLEQPNRLRLPGSALLIAILPVLVFAASDWFLDAYGSPEPFVWQGMADQYDRHAEAANRITVLAGFILFVAGALASAGFFLWTLLRLPVQARRQLMATYAVAIIAGVLLLSAMNTRETQSHIGPATVCIALSPPGAANQLPRRVPVAEPETDPVTLFFDRLFGRAPSTGNAVKPTESGVCAAPRFALLRSLLIVERNLLVLSVGALALGSIGCLTLPGRRGNRRLIGRAVKVQAERLNRYLYLSATLLVVGLLFVNAFLRWPGFIYEDQSSFKAHVDALLLYFGVSYSILMASYYVPVALLLSRAARRAGDGAASSEVKRKALAEPLRAAKVAAAIFAPALASVATNLLDFGG